MALLTAKTVAEAAKRVEVDERTLRRWIAEDEKFRLALAEARESAFETGMGRVQTLTTEAVETLAALMKRSAPPAVRLGAARTVIELAQCRHDAEGIARRLADLEARQRDAAVGRFQ